MQIAAYRDALIDLLIDAYDDAGLQGLCGDGRWEAAVGAVRAADAASIVQRARRSSVTSSLSHGDAPMESWKPAGYNQVSPYLIIDGAADTMDFLINAFDAERLRHFPSDNGRVMHAEVRIGDSVIMLADGNEGWPPISAHVHVYLPDVDEAYRRALEAGAESVQEPVRKEDEDRRGEPAERVRRIDPRHAQLDPTLRGVEEDLASDPDLQLVAEGESTRPGEDVVHHPPVAAEQHHVEAGLGRPAEGARLDQAEVGVSAARPSEAVDLARHPDLVGERSGQSIRDPSVQLGDTEGVNVHRIDASGTTAPVLGRITDGTAGSRGGARGS